MRGTTLPSSDRDPATTASRTLEATVSKAYFSTGVTALFEMATSDAERILPGHLQPIEVRPQRSILTVTAFHFRESEVGPYAELVLSVVVPPVVGTWAKHPKAGFYPFLAATSSPVSRRFRAESLRIPTYPADIDVLFIERVDQVRVRIRAEDQPVVDLTVTQHEWHSTTHLLQSYMMDGEQRLKADVQISGRYTMHEHERGRITLYPHPMTSALTLDEVSPYPFREHWLKEGFELFHPVEAL
jgi:hypothetical protein